MSRVKEWLIRRKYAKMQEHLRTVDCQELIEESGRKVLDVFHFAAKKMHAYRDILHKKGIDHKKIKTIQDFYDHVPILNRNDLFVDYSLKDWSVNGDYGSPVRFSMSSGYSGTYSYGIDNKKRYKKTALYTEFLMDCVFKIFESKTLVINCHPGLRLPTRCLSVAEVVARPGPVLALLNNLYGDFDQFIVMGEQSFITELVETGIGRSYKKRISFITGGEFMPESYRTHIASALDMDFDNPDNGMLYGNFGTTEVSLSMFNENIDTIRIRRAAAENGLLKKTLFGDVKYIPSVMHYFPQNMYVENIFSHNIPTLVVSSLDMTRKIPMIRYNTGDCVRIMRYPILCNKLRSCGYSHLCPKYHLPVAFIWDRKRMQKWQ